MSVKTKNARIVEVQLEIRRLAFEQDSVERFGDRYWQIEKQKEVLEKEFYKLHAADDDYIKAENENQNCDEE